MPESEVVRLDFFRVPAGYVLSRYLKRGEAFIPVCRETRPPAFDLEAALAWCQAEQWEVRRWPGGARAWKHGIEPVRTARQVERMVYDGLLRLDPAWYELEDFDPSTINFRYDL